MLTNDRYRISEEEMAILDWGSCREIYALKPKEELMARQVKENLEKGPASKGSCMDTGDDDVCAGT